jgi:hypothetical protein
LASSPLRPMTRVFFFFQLKPCSNSPSVTFSLPRKCIWLLWICLAFRQVCISYSMLLKMSCFCLSCISTGFAEQIMPVLHVLCYNGSLVTSTIVSLTTAKLISRYEPHRKHPVYTVIVQLLHY